jgi:hypothetical protein
MRHQRNMSMPLFVAISVFALAGMHCSDKKVNIVDPVNPVSQNESPILKRANSRTLSGTVIDKSTGRALTGVQVTVIAENGNITTIDFTNSEGKYRLTVPTNHWYSIVYSKNGYEKQTIRVHVIEKNPDLILLSTVKLVRKHTSGCAR